MNNQRANWDGTWEAVTHVWIKKVQETDGWMATHCYNPCLIFFFFVFCLCPDHLTEAMKASTCEQVRNIRDVHTG